MFFWPNLELTEYEKRFVSPYKTADKPGVLRRSYKIVLNSVNFSTVPGLENPKLEAGIQIARRSRIFALTFSGDVHAWRLSISTASGETYTPRFAGGVDPMVSSISPGVMWNVAATDFKEPKPLLVPNPLAAGNVLAPQLSALTLPLIVDPNWELSPNEQLIFRGTPQIETTVLEVGIHAWEFPGMVMGAESGCPPRMGAGPTVQKVKRV